MLSLDLFNSKYEKPLQEGSVNTVAEQAPENPEQSKYVANFNEFNTPENIAAVRDVWTRIQAHFLDEDLTWQWLTLKWPDGGEAVTLSPNQVFSILKKIASMSNQRQKVTLLTNFGNRNSFLTWLNGVKIIPRPVPKKDIPKGQQSFDLKEAEKKSSDNPKFKSTQLNRLKTQARAKYPSAGSDLEALVADFVDQQEQDQKSLAQVRGVNSRQDDLIRQITALNKEQDQEIDTLAGDEAQLQKNIQQLQAANASLTQKLAAMSQRRGKTTTDVIPGPTPAAAPAGPGVSVAPDKQAPQRDQRLAQYVKRLRQQIKNLELQVALKAPQDQQAMRQEIDALKAQLAQLLKQPEQLAQPSVATTTVGGQQADILAKNTKDLDGSAQDADDVDFTTINPDIAAMLKSMSDKSKKPTKRTKKKSPAVAELEEGSVWGQQDFDTQMALAKMKSELDREKPAQTAPQPAVASQVQPQPVAYKSPERLSDLQARHQKVEALFNLKKDIEIAKDKATKGGRILPRGLAADLEDYYSMDDIDTHYDQMLAAYQKQLKAIEQYLGMKKILNKKVTHEMRASELQENQMETWTVHFTDGTAVRVRVSDETDPAQVRKHYANKGKTVAKFDYGYGSEPETGPGPEAHEPGSGRAVSARTGEPLPENEISVSGAPVKQEKGYYSVWIKRGDRWSPLTKYPDRQEAEEIKRGLEKRGEQVIIREGRAGYNPLTSEKHWHEVERYLASQINDPKLDPESKAEARQRYQEKRKEAQQKGWAK